MWFLAGSKHQFTVEIPISLTGPIVFAALKSFLLRPFDGS